MEHSRPRTPDIIDYRHLETIGRRRLGQLVSLVGWAIWLYLFTPLVALLGWFFGIELFQRHVLDDPVGTIQAVQAYLIAILAAGVVFIGWAGYNWFRFHNRERRRAPPPVDTSQLAWHFGISTEQAEEVERARIVTVHFDDDAAIVAIRSGAGASETDEPAGVTGS